jgi:hypothetical protein
MRPRCPASYFPAQNFDMFGVRRKRATLSDSVEDSTMDLTKDEEALILKQREDRALSEHGSGRRPWAALGPHRPRGSAF